MRFVRPAKTQTSLRVLISVFASRLNIRWLLSYWPNTIWSFYAKKKAAQAHMRLHLSKCHIFGNHMSWLINNIYGMACCYWWSYMAFHLKWPHFNTTPKESEPSTAFFSTSPNILIRILTKICLPDTVNSNDTESYCLALLILWSVYGILGTFGTHLGNSDIKHSSEIYIEWCTETLSKTS